MNMDDLLINNLVEETAAAVPRAREEAEKKGHNTKGKKGKSPKKLVSKNGETHMTDTSAAELCPETIVTMYTSDIVSTEIRAIPVQQTSAGLYFSGSTETESNVKCVLTTILFLAVVAAIVVVAIFKNPGM